MYKLLLLACLLLPVHLSAQTSDSAQIYSLIHDFYFEGWMTGDTALVGRAMHPSCHLKYFRDHSFGDISRSDYLSRFSPHPKEPGTEGRILSLDITGNIAAAKCEIEIPQAIFVDYFNLLKTDEGWFIVDKISTRMNKQP